MSDDLPNSGGSDPPQQSPPQNVVSEPPNPSNSSNIPTQSNSVPNNTVDPVQSWVAQHEQRDAQGHFVKSAIIPSPNLLLFISAGVQLCPHNSVDPP